MMNSTNDVPPWLGQGFPRYPAIFQLVRVYAAAILGTNAYPAFTQQFVPPLGLRDRESVYLWEPNGILLGPGYYLARLVSAYANLPLYATFCCSSGSSSSSSSPPSM